MALTASTSTAHRRPPLEHLSALAVGVIATIVIAVVALQSSGKGDVSAPATGVSTTAHYYSYDTDPVTFVMYIVDSQEKADAIKRSEDEMLMTYVDSSQEIPKRTSSVLVATTPEEGVQAEQLANLAALELVETNTIFQVVDLRGQ